MSSTDNPYIAQIVFLDGKLRGFAYARQDVLPSSALIRFESASGEVLLVNPAAVQTIDCVDA